MLMSPYIKPKAQLAPQTENILCYQRRSGAAGGCGWGDKRRQSFIEGFRT